MSTRVSSQRAAQRIALPASPMSGSALLNEILDDEDWYGNGAPQWLVGRAKHPCQTADEAYHARITLIAFLRKHGAENAKALALADRLDKCRPWRRCKSGACHECGRAFTRSFVAAAPEVLDAFCGGVKIISIVPARSSVPIGELAGSTLNDAGKAIASSLKRAGITRALITLDLAVNESLEDEFEPCYKPHGWVFACARQLGLAEHRIRAAFPRTDSIHRPVQILDWNGGQAALGYSFKPHFQRRVSYVLEAAQPGKRHSSRNTRDRPLRVEQRLEITLALDEAGLSCRLRLLGARLTRTADGPKLRLITGAHQ